MRDVIDAFGGFGGLAAAKGVVHLVGGGPGDAGFLTLRGATLLATCDVVAYDRLSPVDALELVPIGAERVCVGKRSGETGMSRAAVDELLRDRAQAGLAVVRLKGGDPFVFGRGGEEAEACAAAGIDVEIVPGVTSPVAVPGAAGIPVTHRTVSAGFAVATGHEDPAKPAGQVDVAALAAYPGTLVLLMGVERLADLARRLVADGRDPGTPAAVVQWGTTVHQRTVVGTLSTIVDEVAGAGIGSPAVIVVGDVVRLRSGIAHREQRPLHGLGVLLPRVGDGPSGLAAHLRAAGADVVQAVVGGEAAGDREALALAVDDLRAGALDTVVLLAPRVVDALLAALADAGTDVRALAGLRVVALGARTADHLAAIAGIRCDATYASPAALVATPPDTGRTLVLTGGDDHGVAAALADAGATPRVAVASRIESRPVDAATRAAVAERARVVVVPTAAAADPLAASGLSRDLPVVSIGPTTSTALTAAGLDVAAEAESADGPRVVAALARLRGTQVEPEPTATLRDQLDSLSQESTPPS